MGPNLSSCPGGEESASRKGPLIQQTLIWFPWGFADAGRLLGFLELTSSR